MAIDSNLPDKFVSRETKITDFLLGVKLYPPEGKISGALLSPDTHKFLVTDNRDCVCTVGHNRERLTPLQSPIHC